MQIQKDYSLRQLNTFGLNVSAKIFAEIFSEDDLMALISDRQFANENKFVLGGGSNILFTHDLNAFCILNHIRGIKKLKEDEEHVWISSGAGEVWHDLVMYCVNNNYGGIENLSLIPGSAGAAPIQNIGAYGVELKETFQELEAIDLLTGEKKIFTLADCNFGYRDSVFKRVQKNKFIITSVTLRLNKQHHVNTSYGAIEQELKAMNINAPDIKSVSQAVMNIRRSKLPDPAVIGNCGSFFKNPEVAEAKFLELKKNYPDITAYPVSSGKMKLAAGWLIEQCGWKGKRIGNVGMHAKQALVLVNSGDATGEELFAHAKKVQLSVKEKFDVLLEMEVNIL